MIRDREVWEKEARRRVRLDLLTCCIRAGWCFGRIIK